MVAVRSETDVLAVALTVIVPLFDPEDGDTVSQEEALLTAVQLVLEVTVKVPCWIGAVKLNEDCETVSTGVAPACVTTMFCDNPFPLRVRVAVRGDKDVLTVVLTVTVVSFMPADGVTTSHVAEFLVIDQLVLDVTLKVFS